MLEKVNIAVSEAGGKLRVDWISPLGLFSDWNGQHSGLAVKPGDFSVRVNDKRLPVAMMEEILSPTDNLRISVRHESSNRAGSKILQYTDPAMNAEGLFPPGALASPDRKGSKRRAPP